MDIAAPFAAHLAVLSAALENPEVDLEAELRTLASDIKAAVASYTGMTITIALESSDIRFSVHEDPTISPATSLQIPLSTITSTGMASRLLLYAATPGAFVDLAADLSYALGLPASALVLDGHLPPPDDHSGIAGLDTHSALNQAIGILVGRGHTPEAALDELRRMAALDHGDLRGAAEALVAGVTGEKPEEKTDEP